MTVTPAFAVRRASRRDLDALVTLEEGFPGDRISRASLGRLLTRDSAEVFVAEGGGGVVGDAVVLFRAGFKSARLYSLIVAPDWRGRGIAKALLAAAEEAARARGSVSLRLEVRDVNRAALALYGGEGYEVVGAVEGYYEDGGRAVRMRKRFLPGHATLLGVPYQPQTFAFTSGPSALVMAMRHHGYPVDSERWLELSLWRETTELFTLSGHGGCSAHGLAVAALRRGFNAVVVTPDDGVPLLAGVKDAARRDVAGLAHETFATELSELGGTALHRGLTVDEAVAEMASGAVPVVLVAGHRAGAGRAPRWVALTGFDDENLYLHDPLMLEHEGVASSANLAVPREGFARLTSVGTEGLRAALVVRRWGTVTRRQRGAR